MATRRAHAFLAVLACAGLAHAVFDDALDVIKLGKEITEEVLLSWDVIGKNINYTGGVPLPFVHRREREVMSRLARVSESIERLEYTMEKYNSVNLMLVKSIGRTTRLELKLHEMADLLARVTAKDQVMREYVRQQRDLERMTLENFAEMCVSQKEAMSLPGLLERIHALVVPPHKYLLGESLFDLLVQDLKEEQRDICHLQLSQHQLIYDMYNTISLTEIKGYAMMQFSWMLLRIYGKGNFTQEASLTRQRYGERTAKTAAAARAALSMSRRDLYRCDPPQHIEGVTYAEVTRLLQGYVENEVDMNKDGTCKENCAFYTLAENHGCYENQFCARQPKCRGRILECQYIDSDMWVCPANPTSNRRYDWIEYENGRKLGPYGTCAQGITKVDSWWRWLFWHCSYCMCFCDEPGLESDRYFSLRQATSNVHENKIVTGLRIIKQDRVFHLQISEGVLGERGRVTARGWAPVPKFDPLDRGVVEGMDYHTLTYEKRAIDLDELDSPDGHIMTGVRFRMHGPHLHFEIRSTPFNYTTGKLTPEKSQWISNDNTDGAEKPRSRLTLVNPDIPTRHTPLFVDSKHDQYVEFTHSDLETDAAQSTVPFIDIQPVEPLKGAAMLSGAGIIHRGMRHSGGFIAVKVFTYDYTRHVKADPPAASFEDDWETTEFAMPSIN